MVQISFGDPTATLALAVGVRWKSLLLSHRVDWMALYVAAPHQRWEAHCLEAGEQRARALVFYYEGRVQDWDATFGTAPRSCFRYREPGMYLNNDVSLCETKYCSIGKLAYLGLAAQAPQLRRRRML